MNNMQTVKYIFTLALLIATAPVVAMEFGENYPVRHIDIETGENYADRDYTPSIGSRALDGARDLGGRALDGARDLGGRALDGAKNFGVRLLDDSRHLGSKTITGVKDAVWAVRNFDYKKAFQGLVSIVCNKRLAQPVGQDKTCTQSLVAKTELVGQEPTQPVSQDKACTQSVVTKTELVDQELTQPVSQDKACTQSVITKTELFVQVLAQRVGQSIVDCAHYANNHRCVAAAVVVTPVVLYLAVKQLQKKLADDTRTQAQ